MATSPTVTYPLSLHDALPISLALGEADDQAAGLLAELRGVVADVAEALHDDALALEPAREPARHRAGPRQRSEEHTSELQSLRHLVCRLLLEKKKKQITKKNQ